MSSPSPQRCRNFVRGNCTRGDRCKFLHQRPSGEGSPSRGHPSSPSRGRGGGPSRGGQGTPRDVCSYYWTSGSCSRGFECSFKHTKNPQNVEQTASNAPNPAEEEPAFYSIQQLAATGPRSSARYQTMNPSEVHNHIKPFLREQFIFDGPLRVQSFVKVLSSVNDKNKAWNTDNAQSFLEVLVKDTGVIRIGEVLRFKPVSDQASPSSTALSFQQGYFPLLEYLASNLVLKSTWHKNINHLYTVVEENFDDLHDVLQSCIKSMIERRSWNASQLSSGLDGATVFKTITVLLLQYFNRFKTAIRKHPNVVDLLQNLAEWFDIWVIAVNAKPPRFEDSITELDARPRALIIEQIREDIDRLVTIISREADHAILLKRPTTRPTITPAQRRDAAIMRLGQTYVPPGTLRAEGPRHDNDFSSISQIRVAPTQQELLCGLAPYLPVVTPEAPHHLPEGSMERHLDIQFRLLREDLISTIRASINSIHSDLVKTWGSRGKGKKSERTMLQQILAKNGGAYKSTGHDSAFFRIYSNAEFAPVRAERRDLTVGLLIDAPAGAARDSQQSKRAAYWKSSKLLQSGGIVALVVVSGQTLKVFLGILASFSDDIAESSKVSDSKVQVRVTFFEPEVEFRALRREQLSQGKSSYAFLVDSSVMFEAARPFLQRIQTIEPTEIPFARYITSVGSLADLQIGPPKYATDPRFKYNLQCMAKDKHSRIADLDISRPNAVNLTREQLRQGSTLDPSQIEAVLNTLTREISLIQGPPGTGKSFTGREILRILFSSKIRPIVMIAYTNHALDHMLREVLESGITKKIVRLGSRSSDELIAEYTLDRLEKTAEQTDLQRSVRRAFAAMKRLEESMSHVMELIQLPEISDQQVEEHLDIHNPMHFQALMSPSYWISHLKEKLWAEQEENGEWSTVKAKGKQRVSDEVSKTSYSFWKRGEDIAFLSTPIPLNAPTKPSSSILKKGEMKEADALEPLGVNEELKEHPQLTTFFLELDYGNYRPPIPCTDRPLSRLTDDTEIWKMSLFERRRLATRWETEIREMAYEINLDRYNTLREEYKAACEEYNDIKDEARRRLLSGVDLIACTTTGAAKLTSLISSIGPRVLMVEEAGQVLEAHILTSLVASVHHLICIGDPQQLRPCLATFALSMDSARGAECFKFDRSLMERLADSGLPMTPLNVQRRMRPEISQFIRHILYPKLEDNVLVKNYPPVKGMQKNVYFLNHTNREGGLDDSVSKFNTYEVQMIRDLVLYFLKQDAYSGPGDIAVLCAYLGQLQKVRQALRDLKVAVSVDERDNTQLVQQGLEDGLDEGAFEEVVVAKHIRLGTVDIYQGQEAKIVIVSLVRNTGDFDTESASIGFLKSSNRINVALSRAKHGMYILGNASNLRKNATWSTILDDMEEQELIGTGFPIICARHPNQVNLISRPGELSRYAPEGGCLLPCGTQLKCGHICPSVCHISLDNHRTMFCHEACTKAPCPRSHPCPKECSNPCGDCEFPMYEIRLPCGHVEDKVPCYLLEKLQHVECKKLVNKKLPQCEHSAEMHCSKDPATFKCKEICAGSMDCCSRTCKSRCWQCQDATKAQNPKQQQPQPQQVPSQRIIRTVHQKHSCERPLYCLHPCGQDCHPKDHPCNPSCQKDCLQQCSHQKCSQRCSIPCPPCMEPCTWKCEHHSCPVTCGSICTRLPCDEICKNMLKCGHQCPSVCGEICENQKCAECIEPSRKQDTVDFLMQRTLGEIDLTSEDIADRLITLRCGHIFTVETLDGHCRMSDFYEVDEMGVYLRAKVPPIEYQTPPTCPTCRGPITALRYGRVVKRSMLDIMEQNVASTMSRSLEKLGPDLEKVSESADSLKTMASNITSATSNLGNISREKIQNAIEKLEPLPKTMLDRNAMNYMHGLPPSETKQLWERGVKTVLEVYGLAQSIAVTRGAHVKAYEGAYNTLYRIERDFIINHPDITTDAPEPKALEAVKMNIGQPPPTADSKFQIDAYFRTLELRFTLAEIYTARLEALKPAAASDEFGHKLKEQWKSFVTFIYDSCIADALKALGSAKKSSASRRVARCNVFVTRSEFEKFRFLTILWTKSVKTSDPDFMDHRNRMARHVAEERERVRNRLREYQREYIRSRPQKGMAAFSAESKWFEENCSQSIQRLISDLEGLEEFVKKPDSFYEPLSHSEMKDIVNAFRSTFVTSGHFYNCPNGHPFVITECGGAMQTSTCPECGEAIGGGSHRLLNTNTVSPEFEGILRGTGVQQGFY